ncbi:hypothetical protein Trydic_g7266 [Trypoxylus dichotomus]
MNEEKKQNVPQKNKKVGADGLSKKERRALKVAQKADNSVNHVGSVKDSLPVANNKDVKQATPKAEGGQQKQLRKGDLRESNVESQTVVVNIEGQQSKCGSLENKSSIAKAEISTVTPSKTQLRVERRALQEKQRLAKALEKVGKVENDIKESLKPPIKVPPKKIEPKTEAQNEHRKKNKLLDVIETYKQEQIAKAGEAISIKVNEKIADKDVILTYGCSSLIRQLLLDAHRDGKHFKVIIVDSRPLLEGREMLRTLVREGIDCTYGLINSVSFIMSKATKVLLGAHALLANGYVMSRVGTAQIALIAQNSNKPVLVCCETYKFCERVQTDCFVYNEIGDSDKLVNIDTTEKDSPLANWRQSKYLQPLNLLYDVTPPDFVTAVVTELGFIPCTSVPVVLRIKPTE